MEFFECRKTGVDPSEGLLDIAKKKNIPDCTLVKGSAEELPFPDSSFDYVISVTAIHNFKDIEKGLKEMKRVGKKVFVFSILKKAKKFNEIREMVKDLFSVEKEVDEEMDLVMLCKPL